MLRRFFRRRRHPAFAAQFTLAQSKTELSLQNLALGVDNLRHDVWLNERFCESARLLITRLIARMGGVEDLVADRNAAARSNAFLNRGPAAASNPAADPADCKLLLTDLLREALNRAKREENPSIDLLAHVAVLKFLRAELSAQFAAVVERCRERLTQFDASHVDSARRAQVHERFGKLQAAKRVILRACGEQLFEMLRDVEKQTIARMRSSILAVPTRQPEYELFLNRLVFADDPRDDLLNAEHYCMLGHYDTDPDRYSRMRELALDLLQQATGNSDPAALAAMLATPENAHELLGDDLTAGDAAGFSPRSAALRAWQDMLEEEDALPRIIAAYQVPALMPHYAAFVNPQQLKVALTQLTERRRVVALLRERSLDLEPMRQALERVRRCRGDERARIVRRFLFDLMRFCRDLRRLEVLEQVMERVNLLTAEHLRAMSSMNSTLYDFPLAGERKQQEKHVTGHAILKADVRDSTRLTKSLTERGLNPASFFSLNFYDPVTRLLPTYGAEKVFIEGDALILAVLESEANPRMAVARACLLAAEMLRIVGAYNQQLAEAGLPRLELGLGIAYDGNAPLYLVDGRRRIMISPALNEADRLSSCGKRARTLLRPAPMFHVHAGLTGDPAVEEEALIRYNIDGIQLSEAAFHKLSSEITLTEHRLSAQGSASASAGTSLFSGVVPLNGSFRKLIVRQGQAARLAGNTGFTLSYFELCTDPAVEQLLAPRTTAAAVAV